MTRMFCWMMAVLLLATPMVKADTPVNPVGLSMELLNGVRYKTDVSGMLKVLAELQEEQLAVALINDDAKKVFWINVYNAMIQYQLAKDTSSYVNRRKFFRSRNIVVAGQKLSFDDIEHGMLRGSKVKWAGGYIHKLVPSAFERKFRVEKLDWRIHFALNCGAMSCPAVFQYTQAEVDKQLENSTNLFLMFETAYDSTTNTLQLPKLFSWFRNDFGGKKGIYSLLQAQDIIPAGSTPKITYTKYDWSLSVANYK
ncbi:MAG: DUF547 domain-containing protein [Sphingobacteriaceae bacterium]|nr:DUF547 domain-containing protein [Sphingobacteriaceae bacterium]